MARGLFISFEGIDGCGKTTHINLLCTRLQALGLKVRQPREPGATAIGEACREILLAHKHVGMLPATELLLFLAARAQICQELIEPALAQGEIVICDRFLDSSVAYQGWGRELGAAVVQQMNLFATRALVPDKTILLDLPVEVARVRLGKRSNESNRLDLEQEDFMQRVRQGYLALAAAEPDRIALIAADRNKEDTAADIWAEVGRLIK